MEDDNEIDLSEYKNQRAQLVRVSLDKYETTFKRDWKSYLADVFKYDDMPSTYVNPIFVPKVEVHPFEQWLS